MSLSSLINTSLPPLGISTGVEIGILLLVAYGMFYLLGAVSTRSKIKETNRVQKIIMGSITFFVAILLPLGILKGLFFLIERIKQFPKLEFSSLGLFLGFAFVYILLDNLVTHSLTEIAGKALKNKEFNDEILDLEYWPLKKDSMEKIASRMNAYPDHSSVAMIQMAIWFFPLFLFEILHLDTLVKIGVFSYTIVLALISTIQVIGDFFDEIFEYKIYLEEDIGGEKTFEGKINRYTEDVVELKTENTLLYLDRDRIVSIKKLD